MGAMTVPYVFAGIVVSLALTRSPFPVSLVYGVDLLGAALGCAAVVGILNVLDGPSAILLAGLLSAIAAWPSLAQHLPSERTVLVARADGAGRCSLVAWRSSIPLNMMVSRRLQATDSQGSFEGGWESRTERWNSYSRIVAYPTIRVACRISGDPHPTMPDEAPDASGRSQYRWRRRHRDASLRRHARNRSTF